MKKIYTRDQHKHSDAEQRLVSSQEPDLSKRGKGGGGGGRGGGGGGCLP